jgi:hypothetical protein
MKEVSQNSERCKRERAETDDADDDSDAAGDDDDDDDDERVGSASSCMSSCIMLNDTASCASSANISFAAFQQL